MQKQKKFAVTVCGNKDAIARFFAGLKHRIPYSSTHIEESHERNRNVKIVCFKPVSLEKFTEITQTLVSEEKHTVQVGVCAR